MRNIFIYAALILCTQQAFAGAGWTTYTKTPKIVTMAFDGDIVWCGTEGDGAIKYNRRTHEEARLTGSDGLLSNTIRTIAVDQQGGLWFGQDEGLLLYDGESWDDHSEQITPPVRDVEVSETGDVYVVHTGGISRYNSVGWSIVKEGDFNCVAIDSATVWLGTNATLYENYVLRIEDGVETVMTADLKWITRNPVTDIKVDRERDIVWWVAYGIYSCDSEGNIRYKAPAEFHSMAVDKQGHVWGGKDDGLYEYDGKIYQFNNFFDFIESSRTYRVTADDRGDIWVSTEAGLYSYDGEQTERHMTNYMHDKSAVYSMAVDNKGEVWVSHKDFTKPVKVSIYSDGKWMLGPELDHLLQFDDDNVLWTYDWSSLITYDGDKRIKYSLVYNDGDGYSGIGYVYDMLIYNNSLFVITSALIQSHFPGCLKININELHNNPVGDNHYYVIEPDRLPSSGGTSIDIDTDGTIWYTSLGSGIYSFNQQQATRYNTDTYTMPGYEGRSHSIAVEKKDTVWFEARHKGPDDRFDTEDDFSTLAGLISGNYIDYSPDNSLLPDGLIYDIKIDHNNTKWIATESGVVSFDDVNWTLFTADNSGLPHNKVNVIAVAPDNTIWFGTEDGVAKYTGDIIAAVNEEPKPESLSTITAWPNPFNPSTTISFTLPESGHTSLTIYNLAGQKVCTLADESMAAGNHTVVWDGRDESGKAVAAGIYLTRLDSGGRVATGKMVLVK